MFSGREWLETCCRQSLIKPSVLHFIYAFGSLALLSFWCALSPAFTSPTLAALALCLLRVRTVTCPMERIAAVEASAALASLAFALQGVEGELADALQLFCGRYVSDFK